MSNSYQEIHTSLTNYKSALKGLDHKTSQQLLDNAWQFLFRTIIRSDVHNVTQLKEYRNLLLPYLTEPTEREINRQIGRKQFFGTQASLDPQIADYIQLAKETKLPTPTVTKISSRRSRRKQNIYLINGHGTERVSSDFRIRYMMPPDKVLVVFPVCSQLNNMNKICTFIDVMNNPIYNKLMENPIEYKKEIEAILNQSIRVYVPGDYVPDMSTDLFLAFPMQTNDVVIAKSGVYRINGLKKIDRANLPAVFSPAQELGSPLCKPILGVIPNKIAYNVKVHKEVYKGNVYKPAEDIGLCNYNNVKKRSFEIKSILNETGPGIYYYIGCRDLEQSVTDTQLTELLRQSEEQQQQSNRKNKIKPVLPLLRRSSPLSRTSPRSKDRS
jgi:hypothetical protein